MSNLTASLKNLVISSNLGFGNWFLTRSVVLSQARNYAARKGTRERKKKAAKAKVKVEEKKVAFIPHNLRKKDELLVRPKRKFDDSWKQVPTDNVYPTKFYRSPTYSFIEGVKCHKQTHHPDMYNQPNSYLHVSIELNMEGEKKNRFLDNFTRTVAVAHKFDIEDERNVIAFTKIPEMQEAARQAGTQLVGGTELIKQIQNGAISLQDFQYVVAHPNILPELVILRGLMKRKFPSVKLGTLDVNVVEVCERLLYGINYTAIQDEHEKDFGIIETKIGRLSMEAEQLEANFASLIEDVYKQKPKREGAFIFRCLLWSPPSAEKIRINHDVYIVGEEDVEDVVEQEQVVAA